MLQLLFFLLQITFGTYCGSGPTKEIDTNLGAVLIVGSNGTKINDTTNICPGVIGVQNMTNITVTLQTQHNYTIHVNTSSCGYYYKALTAVWIDWNHNQVYEPSELVYNSSGYGWHNGNFTVPSNATSGFTRMRVQAQEGGVYPLNPCEEFPFGGTKDFGVIIMSNNTPPANYCSSGPTTSMDSNLGAVHLAGNNRTINDLNNTCPGFIGAQNLTFMVADLTLGGNYTIQFNTTTCGNKFNVFTAVWIDYNQDHIFNQSELVYNVSGYGMHNGSFRVPFNASLGTTRMRVQAQEMNSYPLNPCSQFPYGGTKDFGIVIVTNNSSHNQTNSTSKYCASGPSNPQNFSTLGAFHFYGETHNISDVNSTKCPGLGGVQNLTAQWANVALGGVYTATINVTHCGNKTLSVPFTAIWIDFNQNLKYDKDELVYNVSGDGFHLAKFEIPTTALKGNTTMRVQTQGNGTYPLDPCANFTHGATKEYTIVLPTFHYCPPGPTMPTGTTLGAVTVYGNKNHIKDNSKTCPNAGPQDLTKQVADVTRGGKYAVFYEVASCDIPYFAQSAVWVDWNENFVFESSELVFNATGYGEKRAMMTIPWTVPVGGTTRMRIQVQESRQSRVIDPCSKFSYGATKDFTLKFA